MVSLFIILTFMKFTRVTSSLKSNMKIKHIVYALLFLLSIQIFAQKRHHRKELPQHLPVYFESHISPIDTLFKCVISYRVSLNNLVFTQSNGFYSSGFGITLEIFDGENFVSRVYDKKNSTSKDYESTMSDDVYEQGLFSFNLKSGRYKLKPSLIIDNTDLEIQIKPIELVVDSSQIYKPIYVEVKKTKENFDRYYLINFQNSILFSDEMYDLLVPSYNFNDEINVQISQNNKIVYDQIISDTIYLGDIFEEKNYGIEISNNAELMYYRIKNVNKNLLEGNVDIKIVVNESKYNFNSIVFWKNKPKSLRDVDQAIDYLNLIGFNKSADSLNNYSDNQKYNALYNFWKKFDDDSSKTYSNVFSEFYSRIDYVKKEFNTLGKNDGIDTDRGRTYLVFGKPDEIERKFNDTFDIIEIWKYNSVGEKIYFSDKTGTGKFERIK